MNVIIEFRMLVQILSEIVCSLDEESSSFRNVVIRKFGVVFIRRWIKLLLL